MKKLIVLTLLAISAVGGAFAQGYMNIGIGYVSDVFNETALGVDVSTKVESISLAMESFYGDPLGFYAAASFGLPNKGTVTIGSGEPIDVPMTSFSTKTHINCMFGLGYRFGSGALDIIAAAGGGFASTMLTPKNTLVDSLMYMTMGPGAGLSVSFNMTPQYALFVSVHGIYGVAQLIETSSYFTSSLIVSPAAGLRIKMR